MTLTLALLAAGLIVIFTAPLIGRAVSPGDDPVALIRILQVAGFVLLVVALLVAPRSPETSAFPPPPDERVDDG